MSNKKRRYEIAQYEVQILRPRLPWCAEFATVAEFATEKIKEAGGGYINIMDVDTGRVVAVATVDGLFFIGEQL